MKTYSEFLRESTIVEGASIIRAGSRKKSTYRGPTGDHKRDAAGHIVADFYNKTKTEYPPVQGKKKKGQVDWQKTKKKNKTIKAQHLANKKKKKESSVSKTPEQRKDAARRMKNYEKLKAEIHSRSKTVSKKPEPQEKKTQDQKPKKKNRFPGYKSPRYKTTDYKNLRPASERMGKNKLKEDAPTMSAGNGGFSSNPENPANQGYDPLMKMMSRWKKAKTYPNKMVDVVNRGKNGR
jgi:hypothetical protein